MPTIAITAAAPNLSIPVEALAAALAPLGIRLLDVRVARDAKPAPFRPRHRTWPADRAQRQEA